MDNNLERILKLTEENNKILRGMRRSQRIKSISKFIFTIILLILLVALYFYLAPTISKLITDFNAVKDSLQQASSAGASLQTNLQNIDVSGIKDLFNNLNINR